MAWPLRRGGLWWWWTAQDSEPAGHAERGDADGRAGDHDGADQIDRGRIAPAVRDGLDALEALLAARGFAGGVAPDEIAQELFEEKGE